MISSAPTLKTCRVCPKTFTPRQPMQFVCGLACARRVPVLARKEAKAVERRERARTRERRDALKTLGDWTKEAQVAFNAWVRARDLAAGHGCIDCGKPFEPSKPGGSVDAGHYLSVGSAVHLRFDERNVFAQRKNCNRPGGTTRAAFRAGVVARIGEDAVVALERDQSVRQYRPDDLKAIRDEYRARLKALQKAAS